MDDLQAAYDALPDPVVVADGDGTVVLVSAAAARLLGRDIVGEPLAAGLPLMTPAGENWWGCVAASRALASVTRQPEKLLVLHASGSGTADVQLNVTARYVREGGTVVRTVVCLRTTGARARAERSSSDLISTVAHELRSPLTSVKGFTATLLAKWDRFPDDVKKNMLATVNADADRVTRLLADLLDVSRIDAGRLELRKQVVDIPKYLTKGVAGRIAAGEPEEQFVLDIATDLPETWGDPDKVDQVVGNLLENAVRHGSGVVTVRLVRDPGLAEGVLLSISDQGPGIPPEVATRVFTKFWRDRTKRGGTGLGLFIVKGLVEAHGGTITVGVADGGGAKFDVRLPEGAPVYDF